MPQSSEQLISIYKKKEDYEIGLLGRNEKELDAKELKIVYVNNQA